ncbi:MAG: plasmid pRiA4b ORF-3 family protein [Desulfobulbaceae bacterium]|nr:plasmid pRiA4b ORF-3 family protein [Desulfobulbaceae bacterium]
MTIHYLPFKITEKFPSSIVTDYDIFLYRVQAPSSYLTKSKHWIDRATLYSINQEVQNRTVEASPKMDQVYYPLLNFFYHISLTANFFQLVKVKNKYRLQGTDIVAEYEQLNTTEKYFSLFEAFWVCTDWLDIFRECRYVAQSDIPQDDKFITVLSDFPCDQEIGSGELIKRAKHYPQSALVHIVRILSFFGILTYRLKSLTPKEQYTKGYIKLKSITVTPFGNRFLKLLDKDRPFTLWNTPFRYFTGYDYLKQDFAGDQFIPEGFVEPFRQMLTTSTVLEKGLPILKPKNLNGSFVFKISIDGTWRTISTSGKSTLADLHLAIQIAYNFDNDHLYSFYFDPDRLSSRKSYHSPEGVEYPYADDFSIGQLNLYVGQELLYVFDYGDLWKFSVEVIEITKEQHFGNYKILQQHGESPEQYLEFDDEGWD